MKSLFSFLVAGLIFLSSPAGAATFLHFNSEPGDYIGGGVEQTWTTESGIFTASLNSDKVVSISFTGLDWWYLDFAGPNGQPLQPGPYENAARYPFQSPTQPGLSVSGNGRGCNTLSGRFDILEAVYTPSGEIERFAADFEQHCEGAEPALFGSIRYNATVGFPLKVDVKANGSHIPISVHVGAPVELTVSIEAGDKAGNKAEKWLGILGPYSNHWYNGKKWLASGQPKRWNAEPIANIEQSFNWTFVKPGVYVVMFASDELIDRILGTQYVDQVVVIVK
jgi:hypothetical protein